MSLLSVRQLSVQRRGVILLDNIDLPHLQAGEILALIGPNGAGKSTLLSVLAGQQDHTGHCAIAEGSLASLGRHRWQQQVALMPQALPQASTLSPYELLTHAAQALALSLYGMALHTQLEALIHPLGLSTCAHRPLAQLSGGQRQLVGLALALLRPASVLLLDEPTSALDLHWRHAVMSQVQSMLRTRGACAVVVLHDLDLALRYCQQLALLCDGQLVTAGTPDAVLTRERLADVFHVEAQLISAPNGSRKLHVKSALPQSSMNKRH